MKLSKVGARAPLRLGLAGGGSDVDPYCSRFGGKVLNATIGRYAYGFIEPQSTRRLAFHAADQGALWEGSADQIDQVPKALQLHRATYQRMVRDGALDPALGLRVTTMADAPAGSGLGTSSTVVVALVQAFVEFLDLPLGEYEIAQLSYRIEREDCGLSGGKQDQYAAAFGGFNFMEFYADREIVNPLRVRDAIVCELEASLVLYFTGVSRESAGIIDAQRTSILHDDASAIEATHAVKQQASVMKERLLRGDIDGVCDSLHEAWLAKRSMASQISNPRIDGIYEAARKAGARAGKISGAGGGGFMMFVVDPVRRLEVVNTLSNLGGQIMACHFSHRGAESWRS